MLYVLIIRLPYNSVNGKNMLFWLYPASFIIHCYSLPSDNIESRYNQILLDLFEIVPVSSWTKRVSNNILYAWPKGRTLSSHVAQSNMSDLKKELDKMEKEGIIRPCPETTNWVHNLVIVKKKNGSLCSWLDPWNLNKYLIHSVHCTASSEKHNTASQMDSTFHTRC